MGACDSVLQVSPESGPGGIAAHTAHRTPTPTPGWTFHRFSALKRASFTFHPGACFYRFLSPNLFFPKSKNAGKPQVQSDLMAPQDVATYQKLQVRVNPLHLRHRRSGSVHPGRQCPELHHTATLKPLPSRPDTGCEAQQSWHKTSSLCSQCSSPWLY